MPVMPTVEWNGKPYEHVPNGNLLAPASLDMERTLFGPRIELALRLRARERRQPDRGRRATPGSAIVAAGKTYYDLMHALRELGLDGAGLERAGIRILKLGMIWPVEPEIAREFAHGLDEILVVEEKGPFLETLLKDALYGHGRTRRASLGKRDEHGAPLLPRELDLDADLIARAVAARLAARGVRIDSVEARLRKLAEIHGRPAELPMAQRTPFFCSGCPHNSSVKAPEGTLVGGGIGCHTMVLLNPEGKGEITGITQMGGEGAQWIGMAPFTDDSHLVQNLGDGTFHHSGSLAVRAAVAAGREHHLQAALQRARRDDRRPGDRGPAERAGPDPLARARGRAPDHRHDRGHEPLPRRGARGDRRAARPQASCSPRSRSSPGVEGVTVLIHDQECAAELRRQRKRGKAAEPAERVWINERVCEGCGDCGEKSNCLSVIPVETEFGRKTQIHQASCNKDFSCLEGDCPSFLTVVPGEKAKHRTPSLDVELPEPRRLVGDEDFGVRMMGIGGTGVVTVNQVLGMAALLDGLHVLGPRPDRPLAEGRPGHLRPAHHARAARSGRARRRPGSVDLYLGFDLLGAASAKNLLTADRERTVAVVSTSAVPTGRMVIDVDERFPELAGQLDKIDAATRSEHNLYLDAQRLSERLFGDHMMTNTLALGAAYQRGLLPVSGEALERAIELNGAAVEKNLAALRWGRAVVAAPDAVEAATRAPETVEPARELSDLEQYLVGARGERRPAASCAASPRCACRSWWPTRTPTGRAAGPRSCARCTWPSRSARRATRSSPRRWRASSTS